MDRGLTSPATTERPSALLYFLIKVYSIAANTFVESVRQPVFAVIVAAAAALIAVSPYITMFTLMQTPRFITDMGLATLLLGGLLLGAFTASNVISHEIENKTVLTVISKPVGRAEFILGKFLGVMGGIGVGMYLLALVLILSVSGGALEADIEQELSLSTVISIFGCMFLAVCYGLYSNYFHDRPFPSRAIGAAIPLLTLCFLVFAHVDTRALKDHWGTFGKGVDLKVIFASIMVLWAVLVLASVAIAASTRLTIIVNVALCSGVFLLGLLSEYIFQNLGQTWGKESVMAKGCAKVLYAVVPNLQCFWVSDYLNALSQIPGAEPVKTLALLSLFTGAYALLQIGVFLFLAMFLFQNRQVA